VPKYSQSSAANPITSLYPGAEVDVFSAEAVSNGERSQALALSNYPAGRPTNLSIDLVFNQAPGAFTIWITLAAKDVAADYAAPDATYEITAGNLDASGANQACHVEVPYNDSRFVSLYVASAPANGGTTLTATIKQ
jgi:hypothetical protein